MSFVTLAGVSAVVAGFVTLWYLLGSRAGILWTARALVVGAVLSLLGVLGTPAVGKPAPQKRTSASLTVALSVNIGSLLPGQRYQVTGQHLRF